MVSDGESGLQSRVLGDIWWYTMVTCLVFSGLQIALKGGVRDVELAGGRTQACAARSGKLCGLQLGGLQYLLSGARVDSCFLESLLHGLDMDAMFLPLLRPGRFSRVSVESSM